MSLNQIQLVPRQVAELYTNVLIDTSAMVMPGTSSTSYLGGNARNILIVVDKPDEPFLPERELQFLNNILTACKLTIADVAIVNRAHQPPSFTEILSALTPEIVLLFDITSKDVGLPVLFPHYQVQSFNGQVYLSAPSLRLLEDDKPQKALLWTSLKKLFGL